MNNITIDMVREYLSKPSDNNSQFYCDGDDIYDKETDERICGIDTYALVVNESLGLSFKSICDFHIDCSSVIQCTKCGTIIFYSYDELDHEPDFRCPVCTDKKTNYTYWTKEEIEISEEKQKSIEAYKKWDRLETEAYERRKSRNGKYDWEIWSKEIVFKNKIILFELQCDNITKSYLRGLRLHITGSRSINRDKSGNIIGWTHGKQIRIPLSFSNFYIRYIYRHLGKCHPSLRSKYYIGKPSELKKHKKGD